MNTELAKEVLVQTLAFPEHHDQDKWAEGLIDPKTKAFVPIKCASTACLAGTTVILVDPNEAIRINAEGYDSDWIETAADALGADEDALEEIFMITSSDFLDESIEDSPEKLEEAKRQANQEAISRFADYFGLNLAEVTAEAKRYRKTALARQRRALKKSETANG